MLLKRLIYYILLSLSLGSCSPMQEAEPELYHSAMADSSLIQSAFREADISAFVAINSLSIDHLQH